MKFCDVAVATVITSSVGLLVFLMGFGVTSAASPLLSINLGYVPSAACYQLLLAVITNS